MSPVLLPGLLVGIVALEAIQGQPYMFSEAVMTQAAQASTDCSPQLSFSPQSVFCKYVCSCSTEVLRSRGSGSLFVCM